MRLEKALVDQGFKGAVVIHGAVKDITVEWSGPARPSRGTAKTRHSTSG